MNPFSRYDASVVFLSGHVDDWAGLIELVGPCRPDPKAAQQLTAKAGDAIIGRIKGLFDGRDFSTPEDLIAAEFEPLRACGFSASKIATTIKVIRQGTLDGLIPTRDIAAAMDEEALIERIVAPKGIVRWTVVDC